MKAILVIETDAEHIEDLYVEHIWNDCYPVELGKKVYFKPMPNELEHNDSSLFMRGFVNGFNSCVEILKTYGESNDNSASNDSSDSR